MYLVFVVRACVCVCAFRAVFVCSKEGGDESFTYTDVVCFLDVSQMEDIQSLCVCVFVR